MREPITVAGLAKLDRNAFVGALGGVFEHSPWVMEQAWEKGPFVNRAALLAALDDVLHEATREQQLSLINAHPELAGKAAVRGDLTADSAREQASAGLANCSPEEFASLQQLNAAYRAKFGWPFIVAVKGLSRQDIIGEMARRIERSPDEELSEALTQILRIASFRLDELIIDE